MSKLKKINPNIKRKVLNTAEFLTMSGLLAFSAKHINADDYLQPNKIIKPQCLIVDAAIEMSQKTDLDLACVDNEHISVNGEILLNEEAMAKYPKDRKAITAFVQYHWYLHDQAQTNTCLDTTMEQ